MELIHRNVIDIKCIGINGRWLLSYSKVNVRHTNMGEGDEQTDGPMLVNNSLALGGHEVFQIHGCR